MCHAKAGVLKLRSNVWRRVFDDEDWWNEMLLLLLIGNELLFCELVKAYMLVSRSGSVSHGFHSDVQIQSCR